MYCTKARRLFLKAGGLFYSRSNARPLEIENNVWIGGYILLLGVTIGENGLKGLSNMILIGKLFQEVCCDGGDYHFCTEETLDHAIQKCIPPKKANMLDFNRKAIAIGQKA